MSTAKTSLSSKLFLSAFLKRPCILEEEALALLRHCLIAEDVTDADENRPNLDTFVSQCNRSLDAIDMAILRVSHPNRDAHYYILTNYKHDEIAKLATNYKPTVLETFKNVLNSILQSSNGTISSTSILNSISSSSISKAWFEKTILREWQTDYWLEEIDVGVYTLGIRALHELKDYIREDFEDAKRCQVCEEVTLRPTLCTCQKSYFHPTCLITTTTRSDVICSQCGTKLSFTSY